MKLLRKYARLTEIAVNRISRASNIIGVGSIAVLMVLITSDVLGRFLLNCPIAGTVELSEYVMVVVVYLSVSYCQIQKGHVAVDIFMSRLSERGQAIVDCVTGFASLVLFCLIAWRAAIQLVDVWSRGDMSIVQEIPVWPFQAVLVFGVVMLCLVLVVDLVHFIDKAVEKDKEIEK